MTKSTKMWSAIDVYYKHGEASLHSFVTENALSDFLLEKLNDYSRYMEVDYKNAIGNIDTLINYTIELGQGMIINQYGYGVIAVNMLDFKTQDITVYEYK